ncbi:MAG: Gfo/Idh/MocA family oxidoreductase [Candidatus Latescibacterota bacterium]|nr:Gfo/Idh/MocA family oxidoreductase [Candidatus Latescibacterota bacterium]
METVKWGIIGCGNVCEMKNGPGLYKANHSELVAVMRRDGAAAENYAKRHNVARWYNDAQKLIDDNEVNAIFVATPPSTHCEYALLAAAAGKPCVVEKPMACNAKECEQMVAEFKAKEIPLFTQFYRRGLPRFVKLRELLRDKTVGLLTSVHIVHYGGLATGEKSSGWRYDPEIGGAGQFFDLASHGMDILDFLVGPVTAVSGHAINTGGSYAAEDVTVMSFLLGGNVAGTGVWNFNANHGEEGITFTGSNGQIWCPVFGDLNIEIKMKDGTTRSIEVPNPQHVGQPLQETIVAELRGDGTCESTGESGLRTQRVLDACVKDYYGR